MVSTLGIKGETGGEPEATVYRPPPLSLCPIANICLTSGFRFESQQNPQGFIDRNALDQGGVI